MAQGQVQVRAQARAQAITVGAGVDRIMGALISGLEIEFGRGAGTALAERFLQAEETEFCWDARVSERWLGSYECQQNTFDDDGDVDDFDDGIMLDRVAICGRLDGRDFVATVIVDGDGNAHGMLGKRDFGSEKAARSAFAAQR